MASADAVDVHQHLWPEQLVDRLRARAHTPYVRGWTLHTRGEPPFEIDPADHDVQRRVVADHRTGSGSLVSPCPHRSGSRTSCAPRQGPRSPPGTRAPESCPTTRAWASVPMVDPDLDGLAALLREGFVGVQLPATDLRLPAAWERAGDVLEGGRARRQAGARPPRAGGLAPVGRSAARLVGAGRRLRHPAPGGLVGMARRGRSCPVPVAACGVRRRGGPRARAPRATRRARR